MRTSDSYQRCRLSWVLKNRLVCSLVNCVCLVHFWLCRFPLVRPCALDSLTLAWLVRSCASDWFARVLLTRLFALDSFAHVLLTRTCMKLHVCSTHKSQEFSYKPYVCIQISVYIVISTIISTKTDYNFKNRACNLQCNRLWSVYSVTVSPS